jgi:hypothetical protein
MSGYEQYKIDTEVWLSWFIQAAEDNGSEVQKARDIDESAARTGRLKGKLRKEEEEQARIHGRRYLISTEEIQNQARFICKLKYTLTMPRVVWRCYKNCLKTRERYSQRYAAEESSNELDNQGHRYFNQILADVHNLIKDRVLVQPVASAPQQQGSTGTHEDPAARTTFDLLANLDLNADDYEPESNEDILSDTPKAPSASTIKTFYSPKLSEEEEVRLKLVCILTNWEQVIKFIGEQWTESSLDDAIAAFLTDATMALNEQEVNRYYQHRVQVGGVDRSMFALDPDEPGYLPLGTLESVSEARRLVGSKAYELPITLRSDREDIDLEEDDNLIQEMNLKDGTLVQYMMDLGLESVSWIFVTHSLLLHTNHL